MAEQISQYTKPLCVFSSKLDCLRVQDGNNANGIFVHSYSSMGCLKVNKMPTSRHVDLATSVLMKLFKTMLMMVMSAVLVVSSSRHLIRLPPAVIRILFGSYFCGLKSPTMRAYMDVLPSEYMSAIWAWSMTNF